MFLSVNVRFRRESFIDEGSFAVNRFAGVWPSEERPQKSLLFEDMDSS